MAHRIELNERTVISCLTVNPEQNCEIEDSFAMELSEDDFASAVRYGGENLQFFRLIPTVIKGGLIYRPYLAIRESFLNKVLGWGPSNLGYEMLKEINRDIRRFEAGNLIALLLSSNGVIIVEGETSGEAIKSKVDLEYLLKGFTGDIHWVEKPEA